MSTLEPLKWLALITMVIDHLGKTLWPEAMAPMHAAGRLAFPLFVYIMGIRLAVKPHLDIVYLRRLPLWALLAQPAYVLISGTHQGNILCLLLCGALMHWGIRHTGRWQGIAALVAGTAGAWWCEYGPGGAWIPTIIAATYRRDAVMAAMLCGPLAFVAQLPMASSMLPWNMWALMASGVVLASAQVQLTLPRINRWFFYAFYPGHLYLLYGLMWWEVESMTRL
ncbi:MAG: TraX family protein [Bradymonadia bacterium]